MRRGHRLQARGIGLLGLCATYLIQTLCHDGAGQVDSPVGKNGAAARSDRKDPGALPESSATLAVNLWSADLVPPY